MSLRNLVEDQCGAANSLVQLTTHFVEDRGIQDQGLLHPFQQHENLDQHEASTIGDTSPDSSQAFRMDSLLSEMRDLEVSALNKSEPIPQTYTLDTRNENVSDWANQYLESGSTFAQLEDRPYLQSIWSNESQSRMANEFKQTPKPFPVNEFDFNANWDHEYLKEPPPHFESIPDILSSIPPYPSEVSELQLVAGQIADPMGEPQFSNSKFLKFMNNVSDGQMQIQGNQVTKSTNKFSKWATESTKQVEAASASETASNVNKANLFTQWGNLPMANMNSNVNGSTIPQTETNNEGKEDQYSKELWSKLEERWEQLNLSSQTPWASEFNNFVASVQTYTFAEENPMADKINALEEGKKRLEVGDLPSAVLCFEAAVQQTPDSVEGWLLLGRTQAENEQDPQAISALKKCVELNPGNLDALKELAVCHTNENFQFQACSYLKEWLANHPRYRDLVEESNEQNDVGNADEVTSLMTMKSFNDVLNLYLKAVQRNANLNEAPDADVQNAMGVLLTLNGDYDKATDCFETAVKIRPNDARLWNRLGATFANGSNPQRALEAYRKALSLSPSFIRSRYNLGITYVHLKMYQRAVEHLLTALNQQVAGRGVHGERISSMSDSIWTTLNLALSLSERRNLMHLAEKRDLEALNNEFNISPWGSTTQEGDV